MDGQEKLLDYETIKAAVAGEKWATEKVLAHYADYIDELSTVEIRQPGGKVKKAWRTFYAEAAQGGVLLHPNHHWYVGMSHTEQDIDETLNVCETALWKVKEEL